MAVELPEPSYCSSCGAAMFWARSAKTGRAVPVDYAPTTNGNIYLTANPWNATTPEANYLTKGGEVEGPRFTSHFATCPQSSQHRRMS